ncbi:MAG: hypothetical protein AAFY06_17135 [Pseudomonadota bacterium]
MSKLMSRIISRQVSRISDEDKAAQEAMESLRAYRRQRVASRQLPSQPEKK